MFEHCYLIFEINIFDYLSTGRNFIIILLMHKKLSRFPLCNYAIFELRLVEAIFCLRRESKRGVLGI